MENNYKVYCHLFPNGKRYIGITKQRLAIRFKNGYGYQRCPIMWKAIQKYKWRNIEHNVLFENLTKEEAETKEIELIAKYKSNDRKFGYNIANGGNCIGTVSEETKKIISNKNKGKPNKYKGMPRSEETKRKIRESKKIYWNEYYKTNGGKPKKEKKKSNIDTRFKKGDISYWKGKKFNEEYRKKLSEAHIGKNIGHEVTKETRNKISKKLKGHNVSLETKKKIGKPVKCVETNIIYYCAKEAERQTGISYKTISDSCRKNKTIYGLHWEFVKKEDK